MNTNFEMPSFMIALSKLSVSSAKDEAKLLATQRKLRIQRKANGDKTAKKAFKEINHKREIQAKIVKTFTAQIEKAEKAAAKQAKIDAKNPETIALVAQNKKAEKAAAIEAKKAEKAAAIETKKAEKAAAIEAKKAEKATAIETKKAEKAAAIEAKKAEKATAVSETTISKKTKTKTKTQPIIVDENQVNSEYLEIEPYVSHTDVVAYVTTNNDATTTTSDTSDATTTSDTSDATTTDVADVIKISKKRKTVKPNATTTKKCNNNKKATKHIDVVVNNTTESRVDEDIMSIDALLLPNSTLSA